MEGVALMLDEGLGVSLWVSQPGCAKGGFFFFLQGKFLYELMYYWTKKKKKKEKRKQLPLLSLC